METIPQSAMSQWLTGRELEQMDLVNLIVIQHGFIKAQPVLGWIKFIQFR